MGMLRSPGEGLRPRMSVDSARPPYEADGASCGDDDSEDSYAGVPLSMEHKSGCNQWPPYQHNFLDEGAEDGQGEDEPQPITQEIKRGALGTSLPNMALPRAAFSAFRPPPCPFRVSAVVPNELTCTSRLLSLVVQTAMSLVSPLVQFCLVQT